MTDHRTDHSADLELALRIADAADEVALGRYLATDLLIETKPDTTPVTEADKHTEEVIRAILAQERPADGVLGEEFGDSGVTPRRWIVDPIDATANYLRGVPVWCTLIALEVAGDLVVGVASAPAMARRWWAARGQGAFTRDVDGSVRPIAVSGVSAIPDASFSYSDHHCWEDRAAPGALRTLTEHCWRVRAYGDFLSHMLVAEGAVDIAAEPDLKPWDLAALVPIVTEAGGRITAYGGGPALTGNSAVTTNGSLHEPVLSLLRTGQLSG